MKVASYQSFKYMLPAPSRFENWRGVYYPVRMSPHAFAQRQLEYQREMDAARVRFQGEVDAVEADVGAYLRQSPDPNKPESEWGIFNMVCRANDYALVNQAVACLERLPSVSRGASVSKPASQKPAATLPAHAYPPLIRSFAAKGVAAYLHATEARHDTLDTIKKLGEWSGSQRVDEACYVMEMCQAQLQKSVSSSNIGGGSGKEKPSHDSILLIHCWNALMEVMITGGFQPCRRVHREVYDELGALGLQPTLETYLLLIRSLGLSGEVEEAESVFHWLTSRHRVLVPHAVDGADGNNAIRAFNAMFEVYKENKLLEKSDSLWNRLLQARYPRITLTTVELYLRTLIDTAYTPIAGNISLFGNPLHSELKRIPLILQAAAEHGIAHEMLSPTLARHISNAFISYKVPDSVKYRWARSDVQYQFIQMRKDAQYGDDVKEMMDPQMPTDSTEAPLPVPGARQVPSSTADYYGVYHKKNTWEALPSDELFHRTVQEDRMDDTRMDSKVQLKRLYHWERSSTWMSENPPTRYDSLYGSSKVPLEAMGIRRHLSGDPRRPGLESHVARDEVIVSNAIRAGKKYFREQQQQQQQQQRTNRPHHGREQHYYLDFVETA